MTKLSSEFSTYL